MQTKVMFSQEELEALLGTLKTRFMNAMHRHPFINWNDVEIRLRRNPDKISSLLYMEESGGEPDVVMKENNSDEYIFFDCSKESPERRNTCYDEEAKDSRKELKPQFSAQGLAALHGLCLLTEEEYHFLQALDKVDLKTSSWIQTPQSIRKLGGALFGDCRYNHVFIYHNGAQSYYAVRGFRCSLRV